MTAQELGESSRGLTQMAAQLQALRLGVLVEAERNGTVAEPADGHAAGLAPRPPQPVGHHDRLAAYVVLSAAPDTSVGVGLV